MKWYECTGELHQTAGFGEMRIGGLALHVGSKCSHGSLCRSLSIMPAKLGINGFGRIGRLVFRAAMANPEVEVRGRIVRGSVVLAEMVLDGLLLGTAFRLVRTC